MSMTGHCTPHVEARPWPACPHSCGILVHCLKTWVWVLETQICPRLIDVGSGCRGPGLVISRWTLEQSHSQRLWWPSLNSNVGVSYLSMLDAVHLAKLHPLSRICDCLWAQDGRVWDLISWTWASSPTSFSVTDSWSALNLIVMDLDLLFWSWGHLQSRRCVYNCFWTCISRVLDVSV